MEYCLVFQELIPELFYLPEILINENKVNIAAVSSLTNVSSVASAQWVPDFSIYFM